MQLPWILPDRVIISMMTTLRDQTKDFTGRLARRAGPLWPDSRLNLNRF